MANTDILAKYGIKEVADVTFYKIEDNGSIGAPVLYLDTLKVSTIEQTAEQADARGGKGNPALISWDYGKEINVTLEDALFSAKSMAVMFGNGLGAVADSGSITKTVEFLGSEGVPSMATIGGKKYKFDGTVKVYDPDTNKEVTSTGNLTATKKYLATGKIVTKEVTTIDISGNSFPGTYYVTGDTYARSFTTGEDEFFQFQIGKAKVTSENTITLEAEGDPSVFNMSLKVLRDDNGQMMKLVKYNMTPETVQG